MVNLINRRKLKEKTVVKIIISIAVLFTILIGTLVYGFLMGGFPSTTTNTSNYREFKNYRLGCKLKMFPESLKKEGKIEDYYYFYQDTLLDPTCQIYTEINYGEKSYTEEIERLSNLQEEYYGENYESKYDNENFLNPAYVFINADDHCYEYALCNKEENKIIYVFLNFIGNAQVRFDEKYLPLYYNEDV